MSVLHITGLKKLHGAQEILRGADLRIELGEHVGCVGRNGEGKTTLLRLITGEETPDGGSIVLAKGSRIGYVTQRPQFEPGVTVRAWVEAGLDEVHEALAELERVGEAMGEAEGDELDRLVKRHGELTERIEFLDGWEADRRVETVLSGIGLDPSLWDREARTLSGGEKSRTAMARELVSIPELLLLDEPTNHLDLSGIEWLEGYLREIHSACLIVSHDRRLLDNLVTTVVEVERGELNRYVGNYSRYVLAKEERYRSEKRAWEEQTAMIRREENFIKKHMGSQRTAEAKGRRKKLSHVVRLPQPYLDVRKPSIQMAQVERGGEQVLEATELTIGYGEEPLLDSVEVRIGRGERVGIVGANGSGKTTLLKVLAERMTPLSGTFTRGYRAVCGYYDQETQDLREDSTPFLEIRRDHPKFTDLEVRSHLARFLFRGPDVDLVVENLSGGERARLSLARLVLTEPSWLALDEPTNHLDLAGRTALEEMLGEFPGALLFVSHDREFLDGLATRIVEVKDGQVRSFPGNYTDYHEAVLAEENERLEGVAKRKRAEEERRKAENRKKEEARKRAAAPKPKSTNKRKAKKKNPWKLEEIENAIIELEKERDALVASLSDEATYKDADKSRDAQYRLAEIERDLETKNAEWEEFA